MLEINNISKKYVTGGYTQKALDDVSLNLRDSEFVAILGPSGSGKTTFLNIIGGLDRYDSGDLIINGVSTKKYKDRDWDSYRNHTIGFVFQSYNLIPHQTILSNVELALTISGISRRERKKRAIEVLEKVGLKEQIHKKPNQLSGGQMQRVAIARALVNNPDIVLADEPTGALDSETSLQVMDLLKEVAKNRLVVMVTHNAELAEEYATRIVNIKDGKIIGDTNPYKVKKSKNAKHKNLGKASMGMLTALGLSFNNLKTKLPRTILVAMAGSIGIIGIALILSLSNGVNKYIKDIEKETLAEYPIEITESSFSLASMIDLTTSLGEKTEGDVKEVKMVEDLISMIDTNDLASLKKHFESGKTDIDEYARYIEYVYDVEPIIYKEYGDEVRKVNPNESFSSMGLDSSNTMFSSSSTVNVFFKLPDEPNLYLNEYDVKYGHWPTNKNECVIVTNRTGGVSDFLIYTLGLRDNKDLDQMLSDFSEGKTTEVKEDDRVWNYEDFDGITFKVVDGFKHYTYDAEKSIYIDRSEDEKFVKNLVTDGEELKVVGIISPKEDATSMMLTMGIYYDPSLITDLRSNARQSGIVKDQLSTQNINVLTGKPFGEDDKSSFNFSNLFTVDTNEISKAFSIDPTKIQIDISPLQDTTGLSNFVSGFSGLDVDTEELMPVINSTASELMTKYLTYASGDPSTDYAKLPESIKQYITSDEGVELLSQKITALIQANGGSVITPEKIKSIVSSVMSGYLAFCQEKGYTDIENFDEHLTEYLSTPEATNLINQETSSLLQSILQNMNITTEQASQLATDIANGYDTYAQTNGLPELSKLETSFKEYMNTEEAKKIISDNVKKLVNVDDVSGDIGSMIGSYISSKMGAVMTQSMSGLTKAFSIDGQRFARAFKVNMSEDEVKSFFSAMLSNNTTSLAKNLKTFGYAEEEQLSSIIIYPKDFESKQFIIDILDDYNEEMTEAGETDKVISYTDIVGSMMSSVTTIVNVISYVLIAFTAISLIVSSIMISVITLISVLERRKEIGILRAMGASKHNITQVFNSETIITGFLAGLLGVEISRLIILPANLILHVITDISNISAYLPMTSGIALVLLSVIITLIAGLIPSHHAATSDPVLALRTE